VRRLRAERLVRQDLDQVGVAVLARRQDVGALAQAVVVGGVRGLGWGGGHRGERGGGDEEGRDEDVEVGTKSAHDASLRGRERETIS
jgi:hypothetical protein